MKPRLRSLEAPRPADVAERPEDFLRQLGGPTLVRIPGRDATRTRAVVTLLHGNEPSGLRALHGWLRAGAQPAVDVLLGFGAVDAALAAPGFSHRMLPGRADLNRCFGPPWRGEEGAVARELLERLRAATPEALLDLHNNSGHNPPYGVAPELGTAQLNLTALFAERFVHNRLRLGALVEATDAICPSVTIECGRSGDPAADRVARRGIERFLGRPDLALPRSPDPSLQVLVDPVRVRVRRDVRLAFDERPQPGVAFTMRADVDRHNFETLAVGVAIGWVAEGAPWPVEAADAEGRDVSRDCFALRDGRLETRRPGIPIMMTTSPSAALEDCLFYLARPGPARPPARVAPAAEPGEAEGGSVPWQRRG